MNTPALRASSFLGALSSTRSVGTGSTPAIVAGAKLLRCTARSGFILQVTTLEQRFGAYPRGPSGIFWKPEQQQFPLLLPWQAPSPHSTSCRSSTLWRRAYQRRPPLSNEKVGTAPLASRAPPRGTLRMRAVHNHATSPQTPARAL